MLTRANLPPNPKHLFLFLLPFNECSCCCLRCDVTRAGVGTEVASSRDVTTRNSSQLQASSRSTSIASLRKNHFPQIYCFDSQQIDAFATHARPSRELLIDKFVAFWESLALTVICCIVAHDCCSVCVILGRGSVADEFCLELVELVEFER